MSDTDFCGDLHKIFEISNVLESCFVNNIGQRIICKNVELSAHDALDLLINSYGVSYGSKIILSFCDSAQNVPSLDFATFLPVSRSNAAKTDGEYRRLVSAQLNNYYCGGVVVTMAVEQASHEISYYCELSADDYVDRLFNWSTKCCAEFVLSDDAAPFCSVATPSLRQIAVYAFGGEANGFFSADDCTVGEVCVRLAGCIQGQKPIDSDITDALQAQIVKKEYCLKNYCRLCSVFEAVKRYNASFGVYI